MEDGFSDRSVTIRKAVTVGVSSRIVCTLISRGRVFSVRTAFMYFICARDPSTLRFIAPTLNHVRSEITWRCDLFANVQRRNHGTYHGVRDYIDIHQRVHPLGTAADISRQTSAPSSLSPADLPKDMARHRRRHAGVRASPRGSGSRNGQMCQARPRQGLWHRDGCGIFEALDEVWRSCGSALQPDAFSSESCNRLTGVTLCRLPAGT